MFSSRQTQCHLDRKPYYVTYVNVCMAHWYFYHNPYIDIYHILCKVGLEGESHFLTGIWLHASLSPPWCDGSLPLTEDFYLSKFLWGKFHVQSVRKVGNPACKRSLQGFRTYRIWTVYRLETFYLIFIMAMYTLDFSPIVLQESMCVDISK